MPLQLNLVSTPAEFGGNGVDVNGNTVPCQLGPDANVRQINFAGYGFPFQVRFWKPVIGQKSKWTLLEEVWQFPGNTTGAFATGVAGIEFSSLDPDNPATIVADLQYNIDPVVFTGAPTAANITPGGGFVPPSTGIVFDALNEGGSLVVITDTGGQLFEDDSASGLTFSATQGPIAITASGGQPISVIQDSAGGILEQNNGNGDWVQQNNGNGQQLIRQTGNGGQTFKNDGTTETLIQTTAALLHLLSNFSGASPSGILIECTDIIGDGIVLDPHSGSIQLGKSGSGNSLGFFGAVPSTQLPAITKPVGGGTVDTQARAAIDSIIDLLSAALGYGLTA